MTHTLSWRGGKACNESEHRLFEMVFNVFGSHFLVAATNLSDEHHTLGFRVFVEQLQDIHKRGTDDRITPDPDARALPKSAPGKLVDHLVGKRPAP